ncbi:MOSC domain-containing protein [Endozoicomonas sp. SESOKO3]|uniref:MOSC domain-containing protein n=1 Tax=Endozoicomonas sp. SESOKO3 TaxID=2828744 RepID=UPI002148FEF0|nr:MOSC domain-containing protein [Endozoicomonas sp. SESOKO3]
MTHSSLTVSHLAIHPVKSLKKISVDQAVIDRMGFVNDRRWLVVEPDGKFMTQRHYPKMALISAIPHEDGLTLSASGMDDLIIKDPERQSEVSQVRVVVWKDELQALDAGEAASQWLTESLGVPCKMVKFSEQVNRQVDLRFANKGDNTAFADGFPFLLTTEASLQELNSRLDTPITMDRFRPNIVIQGAGYYAEDHWKRIKIGEVVFRVAKPCSRCVMTTVDPVKGVKTGKDPLMTLSGYRRTEMGVIFGQNLIHESEGIIRLGDAVEIIE